MQFGINWNNGYEVCVLMLNERGFKQWFPLRNFGEHQGDATRSDVLPLVRTLKTIRPAFKRRDNSYLTFLNSWHFSQNQ